MLKRNQHLTVLIFRVFLFAGAILPVNLSAQDYKDSPFGFHYANKLPDYAFDLGTKWIDSPRGKQRGTEFLRAREANALA